MSKPSSETILQRISKAIFSTPTSKGFLQRKCACGGNAGLDGECEECRKTRLQRHAMNGTEVSTAPPIVHEVLRSPGQSLDPATRAFMEPRFGHDFSQVRVHADAKAAESAQAVNALAYTVGKDVVFGPGQFAPASSEGPKLLAHELTHVVQQSRGGSNSEAEQRAELAADRISHDQTVAPEVVGGASLGLHKEENDRASAAPRARRTTPPVFISWEVLFRLLGLQLEAPTLTVPPARRPSLMSPEELTLRRPTLTPPNPSPPTSPAQRNEPLIPSSPSTTASGASPAAASPPSRINLARSGRFSLGLRLGFPESEALSLPGTPPSALEESLRQAEILNQRLTGQIPSGWEAVDKAKLAKAIWGIFSTNIAPDVARNITSSLSGSTGPGGLNFELDIVLLTDFSGGGLSFTAQY